MDTFNDALIQPDRSVSSDVRNSLIITSNYDLLDNDNISVSWSDNIVSVKRPSGLSNLSKIRFRNFKGSMLPYTSLELPKLKVHVITDAESNHGADIDGSITLWGNHYNSQLVRNTLDGNNLISFTKPWTYNSDSEIQVEYNIRECIEEANRRMKEAYPVIGNSVLVNTGTNTWNHFQYTDYYPITTAGSYQFVASNTDTKEVYLLWPTSDNSNNIIHFSAIIYNDAIPTIATMDLDSKIAGVCVEQSDALGKWYVANRVYINNGSFEAPTWQLIYSSSWLKSAVSNLSLTISPKISFYTIGKWGDTSCIVTSERVNEPSGGNHLILIYAYNNGAWTKFFIDPMAPDGDFVCYSLVATDSWCYMLIFVYTDDGNKQYAVPHIYKFSKSLLEGTSLDSPLRLDNSSVSMYIPLLKDLGNWEISKFWTEKIRHGTAGKETYGISIMGGSPDNISDSFIYFVGTFVCRIVNGNIFNCVESFAYKHKASEAIGKDCFVKMPEGYGIINYSDILTYDYSNVIINKGSFMGAQFYMPTSVPILQVSTFNNSLMLGSFDTGNISEMVRLNKYLGYDKNVNNGYNIRQIYIFNMSSRVIMGGSNLVGMINLIDGHATSYYDDFFIYHNDGNSTYVLNPQFNYANDLRMNFMIVIETEPYYFMCYTPVSFYPPDGVSVSHIKKPLIYNQLNTHIFNTIEILILLTYEFNDIELTCNNFPNNNGVIFHINEESQVEFKEMLTDNTQDDIKLQLISNNEPLTLTLLKSLYGNISLSLDWVCF